MFRFIVGIEHLGYSLLTEKQYDEASYFVTVPKRAISLQTGVKNNLRLLYHVCERCYLRSPPRSTA